MVSDPVLSSSAMKREVAKLNDASDTSRHYQLSIGWTQGVSQ